MVNPSWLDQAFIVSNSAVDYGSVDESNRFVRTNPTKVTVERYRAFVGNNPSKMTYFQPVLDRLDFVPSKLDLVRPSLLFEGKGDYLMVEYVRSVLLERPSEYAIVPTRGATGIYELIGLFIGWGVPFRVCLDDDREGRATRKELREKWGLPSDQVYSLGDIDLRMDGRSLSDILSPNDLNLISQHFDLTEIPNKSQIHLFFSEMLAKRQKVELDATTVDLIGKIVDHARNLDTA